MSVLPFVNSPMAASSALGRLRHLLMGGVRVALLDAVVGFPEPEGPTMAVTRPGLAVKDMSCSTSVFPSKEKPIFPETKARSASATGKSGRCCSGLARDSRMGFRLAAMYVSCS